MTSENISRKQLKNEIYKVLFDRIYKGTYAPGTRLREQVFATEFGTSRTPIRDVFQRLAKLRLVKIVPNKGAEVIGLSHDDVEEIYDIRKVLELLAIETAVPKVRLQDLSRLRAKIQASSVESDPETIADTDYELHNYIIEASRRPRLNEILEQLLQLVQRFRHTAFQDPEGVKRANSEHLELIDALFLRDVARAKTALADHLERSKMVALSYLFHNHPEGGPPHSDSA